MSVISFKILEYGTREYFSAVALREDILRKPLGLSFLSEELEQEKDHIQIAGIKDDGIIATAVLVPEGQSCKMQRVVVNADLQARGIGSQMIRFCDAYAQQHGFKSIYCHARSSAVNFYLKNAYQPEGSYFNEDTIAHLKMRKILSSVEFC